MPNMERDWEELKEELKPIISFTFVYGIVSYLEHLGYQEVWKLVSCTLMALNLVTGLILLVVYTMTPRYLQICLFHPELKRNLYSRVWRQLEAWRWERNRLHQNLAIVSRLRCRLVEEYEPEAWCPICYADYAAGDKVFHHFNPSSSPSLQLMYPGCHDLHVAHSACLREWFAR